MKFLLPISLALIGIVLFASLSQIEERMDRMLSVSGVCKWIKTTYTNGDGSRNCDIWKPADANCCDWDYGEWVINGITYHTKVSFYKCSTWSGVDCSDWCYDDSCKCYGIPAGTECSDECSYGEKRCVGDYKQVCGDYDSDPCYEWGGDVKCEYGCKNGECLTEEEKGIKGILEILFRGIVGVE